MSNESSKGLNKVHVVHLLTACIEQLKLTRLVVKSRTWNCKKFNRSFRLKSAMLKLIHGVQWKHHTARYQKRKASCSKLPKLN